MKRRSRTRRVLKWGCTALCALIIAVWIASSWLRLDIRAVNPSMISLYDGVLHVYWREDRVWPSGPIWSVRIDRMGLDFMSGAWQGLPALRRFSTWLAFGLPLWVPLLLAAVPTALLWRRGRLPPGHCHKCGYDLTGNVSGRCPECGTPADPEAG